MLGGAGVASLGLHGTSFHPINTQRQNVQLFCSRLCGMERGISLGCESWLYDLHAVLIDHPPPPHHDPLSILLPDRSFQKANHIFNFSSEAENTFRNPSSVSGPARPSVICCVHLSHLISLSPWSPRPSHAKVGLPWQLLTRA